jgi:hypothetical protein
MPNQDEIRIQMNGRTVLAISRSGITRLSDEIDWDKADRAFWEALVKTIGHEIRTQRNLVVQMDTVLNERQVIIDRLVEENRRLRGLPDGTEDEMLDRWSGILDEG